LCKNILLLNILKLWPGVVAHGCNLSYVGRIVGRSRSESGPGQKTWDLIWKTTKTKMSSGVTQVVESLPELA
jgi:hypothetical protein